MSTKNVIIKTVILVLAVATSVAAILYYKKTVVDPPKELAFENVHNLDLSHSIEIIIPDSLEKRYTDAVYKLKRYNEEGLINLDVTDLRLEDMVKQYLPLFITRCSRAFNQPVWDKPEWSHSFMLKRILELENLKVSSGSLVIDASSDYRTQLSQVKDVIANYNAAWNFVKAARFVNINETKKQESRAEQYKTDAFLKKCVALVDALNELPKKIQNQHLATLNNAINGLNCFNLNVYDDYLSNVKKLLNTSIPEYNNYYYKGIDRNNLKDMVIGNQYQTLSGFIERASNVWSFIDYNSYKDYYTEVYFKLNTYLGNNSDKEELSSLLRNNALSEVNFNLKRRVNNPNSKYPS